MGKIKVLVVDDDKKFCKDLGNIIKIWFGCDITISYLGSDAVALIEKEVFHVVLIDLKMPGIDGFMVLEMAMKKYPNVIPFAVSGVNEIGVTKRVEKMGAWFVSKPVEYPPFQHLLDMLLREKKLI